MFTQDEALDIVLAAIHVHRFPNKTPVWPVIEAPPSAGKTSLLDWLPAQPLPKMKDKEVPPGTILALDSLTPRTFVSGLTDRPRPGLLERVTDAVILIRELSTLSTQPHVIRPVFGMMRRLYDGRYSKSWGTGKTVDWEGKLTFIMAGVWHPASLDAELGARMLTARLNESETDFERLLGNKTGGDKKAYVLEVLERDMVNLTVEDLEAVQPYAEMLRFFRGTVPRDRYHEVTRPCVVEEPHRLIGQLGGLRAGLSRVWDCPSGDDRVDDVIRRVVLSSVPPTRLAVLRVLATHPEGLTTTEAIGEVASLSRVSKGTAQYAIEDLELLGVVDSETPFGTGEDDQGKRGRPPKFVFLAPVWKKRLEGWSVLTKGPLFASEMFP